MSIDIEIYRGDDNIFVAACPELNLSCYAETQDEAVAKLKEDITLVLKDQETIINTPDFPKQLH